MLFSVIGWTIIHSLWQCLGLLAALKLFLGLVDVRRSGALVVGGGAAGPLANGAGVVSAGGSMKDFGPLTWLATACPYLTVGWVLGVVFYGGRLVLGSVELRQLKRSPGVADTGVEAIFEDLRMRMGVVRPLRLLITERVKEPMTFGVLRAVVVLPLAYVSQAPAEQLEMILAHELAHIRRRDYLINLLQHVFDALLFFNPCYRMISAKAWL